MKMTWARRPSATAIERKSCARIWGGNCERGGEGKGGVGKGGVGKGGVEKGGQAAAEGRLQRRGGAPPGAKLAG